jgi:hypothetical protein
MDTLSEDLLRNLSGYLSPTEFRTLNKRSERCYVWVHWIMELQRSTIAARQMTLQVCDTNPNVNRHAAMCNIRARLRQLKDYKRLEYLTHNSLRVSRDLRVQKVVPALELLTPIREISILFQPTLFIDEL